MNSYHFRAIVILGLLTCFVVSYGVCQKVGLAREEEAREAEVKAGPKVRVETVSLSGGNHRLQLMGETRPYASVTLYAKVSGYLSEVNVDKGDRVKQGEVVARLTSPEISKEYKGANADAKNKRAIANRMRHLRRRDLVSAQEAEQAISDEEITRAKLESLAVLKGYEVLRAPFDGIVTARHADPGVLIQSAVNNQPGALPVLTVSEINRLRTYVYLDQKYAYFVSAGTPVEISLTERPELSIKASVTRVSGELDPRSRMMLAEIDFDNSKEEIVAGSLVQVSMDITTPTHPEVSVDSIILQGGKLWVPVLDTSDRVHYQEVKAGDNDGRRVVVLSGLKGGERVALGIGSGLVDGSHVRIHSTDSLSPATQESDVKKPIFKKVSGEK